MCNRQGEEGIKNLPINIAIHNGKELCHFSTQCLHSRAQGIQIGNDMLGILHPAGSHTLPQIPNGNTRCLQIVHLRDSMLRIVYQGLKGAGNTGNLDKIPHRPRRWRLQQHLEEGNANEGDKHAA